jgi:hypothetical protein
METSHNTYRYEITRTAVRNGGNCAYSTTEEYRHHGPNCWSGFTQRMDSGDNGGSSGGPQCGTVSGLHPRNEEWLSGDRMNGVWFGSQEDAAAHQHAMDVVEHGKYEAMAVSPLASGRLNPPDICLIYATPAQMILFINSLQWTGYKKLDFSCVGESACADSWGLALATGEPSLSLPCYAERRYSGVMEDELLMAIPPAFLPKVVQGLEALSANGLRYPIPSYGINSDVRAGMGVSY